MKAIKALILVAFLAFVIVEARIDTVNLTGGFCGIKDKYLRVKQATTFDNKWMVNSEFKQGDSAIISIFDSDAFKKLTRFKGKTGLLSLRKLPEDDGVIVRMCAVSEEILMGLYAEFDNLQDFKDNIAMQRHNEKVCFQYVDYRDVTNKRIVRGLMESLVQVDKLRQEELVKDFSKSIGSDPVEILFKVDFGGVTLISLEYNAPTDVKLSVKMEEGTYQVCSDRQVREILPLQIDSFERNASNNGFHRNYNTTIELKVGNPFAIEDCKLMFYESIVESQYVDFDELEEITGLRFSVEKSIDVERPSSHSIQHWFSYEIPLQEGTNKYSRRFKNNESLLQIEFEIPFHFRYQPVQQSARYSDIEWISPMIFLSCPQDSKHDQDFIEYFVNPRGNSDIFSLARLYYSEGDFHQYKNKFPTGIRDDFNYVVLGTFSLSLPSLFILMWQIIKKKPVKEAKME